ncbi:MAG TPA: hypothetical protein VD907_04765 [Verrucomicrobiae bacterium]|nr:hypothetical protein [Verrucomicrobiae bacterium]
MDLNVLALPLVATKKNEHQYFNMFLPQKAHQQLEQSLRTADWSLFKDIRYTYGQEGDVFYIEDLDLSGLDLGDIPSDFLCFKNCNLDNATFEGMQFWPTALWSCSARHLGLENTTGMLFAYRTDLRGAIFDKDTKLYPSQRTDLPSAFEQCQLDDTFKEFVLKQGATLHFPKEMNIPFYAFGVKQKEAEIFYMATDEKAR